MKYFSAFLFCLAIFSSCENEKYEYPADAKIELAKDPCFGFCPVYSFTINGDGKAVFNGTRNVEKEGEWTKVFSMEETNALFDAFSKSNFWGFEDEYTAQVTDLPTTWISFEMEGKSKKIKDYYGAPLALKKLEKMAEMMAEENEGWLKKE